MSDEKCMNVNLCNDLVYTFGSNVGCRAANHPLQTTGGTGLGYVVNKGKLKYVKIVWNGTCEADELITITKNGQDVEEVLVAGKEGIVCVEVSEDFGDCDVINVVSRMGDDGRKWIPAGCITVALEYEPQCDAHINTETTGIAEYFLNPSSPFPTTMAITWTDVIFDQIRINTIPASVSYAGTGIITLQEGVYKVDYSATLATQTSTSLNLRTRLATDDGTGFVEYPSSLTSNYMLAGAGGTVTNGQGVVIVVPVGTSLDLVLEGEVDLDSSVNVAKDANIIIEKIASGPNLICATIR